MGGVLVKFLCLIYSLCVRGNLWWLSLGCLGCIGVEYGLLKLVGMLLSISLIGFSMVIECGVCVLRLLCMVFFRMFMLI